MPRILIIKMSSLGDLFHALPAAHALREGLQAEIDWVVNEEYVDLVRCFGCVREVIPFPRRRLTQGLSAFRRRLKAREYDLVIDLQGLMKSALVSRWARTKRRIGPSFHREGSKILYTEIAGQRNKNRHAVEECLDVVRHLQIPLSTAQFPLNFPAYPVEPHRPRIALLPCSRHARKNWIVSRFSQVARALCVEKGASLYLIGGKDDHEVCARIAKDAIGPVANLCGETTMPQLGGLLRQMDVLLTVDSGPMHVAAAVGTPVVALFGPTFPVRTGPYGRDHVVLKKGDTMDAIQPADVLDGVERVLKQKGIRG